MLLSVSCDADDDCPAEAGTIDAEEAPDVQADVAAAAKELQDYLEIKSLKGGVNWVNIARFDFYDNETTDPQIYEEVVELLRTNQPVVLSGVPLTRKGMQNEHQTIWQSVRSILGKWREESPEHHFKDYWKGKGLGRCENQSFDASSWKWPWPEEMSFWLRDCGAFGSHGGKGALGNITASLASLGGPGAPVHFDSECEHAFAVQVMGSKLYWLQGPDPQENAKSRAGFMANYYAINKFKEIATPSDMYMRDYAAVLSPGDILLYNLWMPHIGLPVRGHSWSFNGNFEAKGSNSTTTADDSQPRYLKQLCEMKKMVPGFMPGHYPQVQPWDPEWDAMASEIRHSSDRSRDWHNVIFRWTHIWRNRVCGRERRQPQGDLGSYRDARCRELPADISLGA